MLRQLPPTITADETPDWLPAGWDAHSTVLKRGRQTRMDKIREQRLSGIKRKKANLEAFKDGEAARERSSWLPHDLNPEPRIGSYGGNPYMIYENMSNDFKTHSMQQGPQSQNTMESEASSEKIEETSNNYITYAYDTDEEDYSENEYVEDKGSLENMESFSNVTSTPPLRSLPERMQKLESRAITQCLLEDEDMSSDGEERLLEVETSKEENVLEETQVTSHFVESFEEQNLHDLVVVSPDKAREILDLTGTFSIEINIESEFVEKDWNTSGIEKVGTSNTEIRDQDSDLMKISTSSKVVEVTQEPGDKSGEPLKAQDTQEEAGNESRRSVFFPDKEAPSHSVLVFDSSNARSSADDPINTIELGLNPCPDTLQEQNISGSKKRNKSAEPPCSSKNSKKKDMEAPTAKLQKGKRTPKKPQGEKGSSSVKPVDWPEPCPNFPFEPLSSSSWKEDDSVIRRYLEQHFTAAGSDDSNFTLPDFGLPSFSDIEIISLNEEESETKKQKSPDPPCVHVASSSLPSCWSMTATTMQHTVAGN
ncbi:unnamed protein product [Thlaspi arvense]|uniref:Uncharacterized protein n=1 Tax=Thlaspi arvense TaxID=13288 RepID=A0AAU9RRU6_THLAR|nr:unnamed protein product [Thlaspi arvense]